MAKSKTTSAKRRGKKDDMSKIAKIDFPAVLTREDVEKYEADHNEQWGVKRRISLIALTRTRDELISGFGDLGEDEQKRGDTLLEVIQHMKDWEQHCKDSAKMASMAQARMLCAAAAIATDAAPQKRAAEQGSPP